METMVVVINTRRPERSLMEFACKMAAMNKARIAGLFIENIYEEENRQEQGNTALPVLLQKTAPSGFSIQTDKAVSLFKEVCQKYSVPFDVSLDKGEPIRDVIHESRYTDMLIIDPATHFYDEPVELPSHFVREVLTKSECPVLLSPQLFDNVSEIIFCFDGKPGSIYAIKQFTYLFPEFGNKKLTLLEVVKNADHGSAQDHNCMMRWLRHHYNEVNYETLIGKARKELFNYLKKKNNAMLVMGSFGRGNFSTMIHGSLAEHIISGIDLPLFNVHV